MAASFSFFVVVIPRKSAISLANRDFFVSSTTSFSGVVCLIVVAKWFAANTALIASHSEAGTVTTRFSSRFAIHGTCDQFRKRMAAKLSRSQLCGTVTHPRFNVTRHAFQPGLLPIRGFKHDPTKYASPGKLSASQTGTSNASSPIHRRSPEMVLASSAGNWTRVSPS